MSEFTLLRLLFLSILVLASLLNFASAGVKLYNLKGRSLPGDGPNQPDPFVKIWCGSDKDTATTVKNNKNPTWTKTFEFKNCNIDDKLTLEMWDEDLNFHDFLGEANRYVRKGTHDESERLSKSGTMEFTYKTFE